MKIGFIILCRFNSSRLPGKILKEIQGKPILKYIVESISNIVDEENIVVATSEEDTDLPIVNYCKQNNIQFYRGDLSNVSKRFRDCAVQYRFDYATRINGDNIFIDQSTISEMLEIAQLNQYDFISNVKGRTFPKGMSVEIVRVSHYQKQYSNFKSADDFEHVTIHLYQNDQDKNYYYFYNKRCKQAAGLQFAVDSQEDFDLAEKIILDLGKDNNFGLEEVYQSYIKLTQ